MKSSILLTILVGALVATVARTEQSLTEVIKTKDKNRVVLKIDKRLMGAHVEVLTATRECLICQKASDLKMNINLSHVEPGTFTVKIVKGWTDEELRFVKE